MSDEIDSIVKGAPIAAPELKNVGSGPSGVIPTSGKQGDPLNHTPSSPSMVYLNLLILEASLRAQFLELRARRRHHIFFMTLLTLWVAFFGYKLYFAPREDGRGVGGSIYWALEGAQKVCFMGGVITAVLIWATGIWDRGVRWPRKWFAVSNRGLRGFNCKLVIIRRPWWAETLSTIGFFLTYGLLSHTASSSYRHVDSSLLRETEKQLQLTSEGHPTLVIPHDDEEKGGHEEDMAPGGDYVKLLLLPKPFSATFRENWELYRTEYWERENERRALLRQKVKDHDRKLQRQRHGWLWWLPWRRIEHRKTNAVKGSSHASRTSHSERARRHRSGSNTHRLSISSTRSQTPSMDGDDTQASRRLSSASEKRRKKPSSISKGSRRPANDSRAATPEHSSPLTRESPRSATPTDEGRVLRSAGTKSATGSPARDKSRQ